MLLRDQEAGDVARVGVGEAQAGHDRGLLNEKLVAIVVHLCHELGALVVAEGIETNGEYEAVRDSGAQYGQGVATCRTATGWSAPVFIQLTGASFGFQAGGESTDLVLVGVNRRSLDDLLKDKVKLGGDIAAAAGPVGRDSQAATTELANAEFLTYSRSKGLFAGVDLTGDEVHQNTADTEAYYGKDLPYKTILSGAIPTPPSAHHFVATVNEMFRRGADRASK